MLKKNIFARSLPKAKASKTLSLALLPALFLALFMAGKSFISAQNNQTTIDMSVNSISITLDENDPTLVTFSAIVQNKGNSASNAITNDGWTLSFKTNTEEQLICETKLPVLNAQQQYSASCTTHYTSPYKMVWGRAEINTYNWEINSQNNLLSFPLFPDLRAEFVSLPRYFNILNLDLPPQVFVINIKNNGFPLQQNLPDNFWATFKTGYQGKQQITLCKTPALYKDLNTPQGQTISCALTQDAKNLLAQNPNYNYYFHFSSKTFSDYSPVITISSTIGPGQPNLKIGSVKCSEPLTFDSPIACETTIVDSTNGKYPVYVPSQKNVSVAMKVTFKNQLDTPLGPKDLTFCKKYLSSSDIATLNEGKSVTKQCFLTPFDIPANTKFINIKAVVDEENIIPESYRTDNTAAAPYIVWSDKTSSHIVTVELPTPTSATISNIKLLFKKLDSNFETSCITNRNTSLPNSMNTCVVSLPPGEYLLSSEDPAVICAAPDCPLKFQVTNQDINLFLNIKYSTAIPQCYDSDSTAAKPEFTPGYVRVSGSTFVDACDSVKNRLREYSCVNNTLKTNYYTCPDAIPNGCYGGACINFNFPFEFTCLRWSEIEGFRFKNCPFEELEIIPQDGYCSVSGGSYLVRCTGVSRLPDLTINAPLNCPKQTYAVNEPITGCSVGIINNGTSSTMAPPTISLFDTTREQGRWIPISLAESQNALTQFQSQRIIFPEFQFATSGIYKINACIDADWGEIKESNEENNCSDVLTLTVGTPPALTCSDCGKGLTNICDKTECESLGQCIFFNGFLGLNNKCFNYEECKNFCLTQKAQPVCAQNGTTYQNECLARCDNQTIAYQGECKPLVSCQTLYAPEWWCGSNEQWQTTCQKEGLSLVLNNQVCDSQGNTFCNACGVQTQFKAVDEAGTPLPSVIIKVVPTNNPNIAQKQCQTDNNGYCSLNLIPGTIYTVNGSSTNYQCTNCEQILFTAKANDTLHILVFEYKCFQDADCIHYTCDVDYTSQCINGKCVCQPRKKLPDLTVQKETLQCVQGSYKAKSEIKDCSVIIENIGEASSVVPPTVDLYDVTNQNQWEKLSSQFYSKILEAGQLFKIDFNVFTINTEGTHRLRACIDESKQIPESNENNNCSEEISLSITKPNPPTCSDCGKGPFNICDQTECESLGNCIFFDGFLGLNNKCLSQDECKAFCAGQTKILVCTTDNITSDECSVKCDKKKVAYYNECHTPVMSDCASLYGADYWCGSYGDWLDKCQGKGLAKELLSGVCNEKGDIFCNTCKTPTPQCNCEPYADHVCGKDGITYTNACFAQCANVEIAYKGDCARPPMCLPYGDVCVKDSDCCPPYVCSAGLCLPKMECTKNEDCASYQACNINEKSTCYNGRCTCVAKPPQEQCVCTQQYDPVCGADGKTYNNACFAQCAKVEIAYKGECKTLPQLINCKTQYGADYWCSNYADWTKVCYQKAKAVAFYEALPCNDKGENYCVTCDLNAPETPSACSDCGKGLFNICDQKECERLGEQCVFSNGQCITQKQCVYSNNQCLNQTRENTIVWPENPKVKLIVPPDAFIETVTVSINASPIVDTSGLAKIGRLVVGGQIVNFSIKNSRGEEIHDFAKPITIEMPYDEKQIKGMDESDLRIYLYNEKTKQWEALDTQIDKKRKVLKATTKHFSPAAATASNADNVCKPCDVSKDECGGDLKCIDGTCQNPEQIILCPFSTHKDIKDLIDEIMKWVLIIGLALAPLMMVIGGFYFLTAGGNPERAKTGKKVIIYASIGLAIVLFAKAFTSIIRSVLQ